MKKRPKKPIDEVSARRERRERDTVSAELDARIDQAELAEARAKAHLALEAYVSDRVAYKRAMVKRSTPVPADFDKKAVAAGRKLRRELETAIDDYADIAATGSLNPLRTMTEADLQESMKFFREALEPFMRLPREARTTPDESEP